MLARLARALPVGPAWRYEPKFDGFRGLLGRGQKTHVSLMSRNGKDLLPWFPELAQAARVLPVDTTLDGEIVIANQKGVPDFGALQQRLARSARQLAGTAIPCPAILVIFDVLALAGSDLMDQPLGQRRRRLEALLGDVHPCLQLVEQTASIDLARDWLASAPALEGVVAKRVDGRYKPGYRGWTKVKRERTADCVVVGLVGDERTPALVLALRDAEGELRTFGVTRAIPENQCEPIPGLLSRAGPVQSAIPSRWQHDQVPPWRPVPAEAVCEVRFTNLDRARWLRFPAAFLRWRPDRSPDDCGLEQLTLH
jgi:ATP-dependent DNA ligase